MVVKGVSHSRVIGEVQSLKMAVKEQCIGRNNNNNNNIKNFWMIRKDTYKLQDLDKATRFLETAKVFPQSHFSSEEDFKSNNLEQTLKRSTTSV